MKYRKTFNKLTNKNEIIINSYNLVEMLNICKNLKLKSVFGRWNFIYLLYIQLIK